MKIPTAGEVMKKGVESIEENATILEAVEKMAKTNNLLLLVTSGGKPAGVLSSGELFNSFCIHVAGHFHRNSDHRRHGDLLNLEREEAVKRRGLEFCSEMKVRDVMTPRIKSININEGIDQAILIMKASNVRRLMVVDEKGNYAGVLARNHTLWLLIKALSQR